MEEEDIIVCEKEEEETSFKVRLRRSCGWRREMSAATSTTLTESHACDAQPLPPGRLSLFGSQEDARLKTLAYQRPPHALKRVGHLSWSKEGKRRRIKI